MFPGIDIGLSGMDAFTKGLQVIANNVTNLDSIGFKASSATFLDMFDPSSGELTFSGGSSQSSGEGVTFGTSVTDFTQGTLEQTSGDLDLAIQGSGFLVLQDGAKQVFARTGSFSVDPNGFVVEQGTGFQLTTLNASGQPVALNLKNKQTSAPVATTTVTLSDNLSSSATTDTVGNISVFDSTGAKHTWQVVLTPNASSPGQWNATVTDETGATVGTGTINFNGSAPDPTDDTIVINTTPTGAQPLSVTLDFSQATSFSEGTTSTLQVASSNGNAAGSVSTVTVDSSGNISLTYTNGQTVTDGAVAMADFIDPQQLTQQSGGVFANNNGAHVTFGSSGEGALGTIVSKQLEESNVDLSQEFGELILIQRGFQASSQVVSVANDMIQQLFGIRGQG